MPSDEISTLRILGINPGTIVLLEQLGGIKQHEFGPDIPTNLSGVFSATNTLLSTSLQNRIPDAIKSSQPDYVTPPTFFGGQETNIDQDFEFSSAVVSVPQGATYLFIGGFDTHYSDNSDPNNDYQIRLTVQAPEPSTLVYLLLYLPLLGFLYHPNRKKALMFLKRAKVIHKTSSL